MDQKAAMRMIRLSGQQGVPVITVDDHVVVGFDRAKLERLLAAKQAARVELGLSVADALPKAGIEGAFVGRVKSGSAAELAGLVARDVIVEINGEPVRSAADLRDTVSKLGAGSKVRLSYVRAGRRQAAELSLA
ncbi:MAG: Periplasmic pH-dependent serine endoprotease DegQ precursor [Chloroflexi bacterium ADurb.Bin180]|nr:MAG: Periplasmic pH-dependent serine endoprotease DegQ precursor [Chloroflexi bacterium ADurb.Bin180]